MNICIAGQNDIAIHGLELALARFNPAQVMVCPSRRDQPPPGWRPSLRTFAASRGVRVVTIEESGEIDDLLFLSLQFDTILDPTRFRSRRLYNLHFSLLPAYKGLYTVAWPLLNGETTTGVTLHEIDHGIDTGDIVSQKAFPIPSQWNSRDLFFACMRAGIEMLEEQFDRLLAGRPPTQPQAVLGSSYYSRDSIDYANLRINLAATAHQVSQQVRAFHFREFQIPVVHGMPVSGVEFTGNRSTTKPGTVVDRHDERMWIATIDYDVKLHRDRSLDFFSLVARSDAKGIHEYAHGNEHIDVTNSQGLTPLMVACKGGQLPLCEALLNRGANASFSNPNGLTPLLCAQAHAESSGDHRARTLLLSHGADPGTWNHANAAQRTAAG